MVVFVDLAGDDEELQDIQHSLSHHALTFPHLRKLRLENGQSEHLSADDCRSNDRDDVPPSMVERENPNINCFSAALSCYP